MEFRMLQIIDDDNDEQEDEKRPELVPIEQLMDYFIFELSSRNNFEFLQAVIRLFLKVCWQLSLASSVVYRSSKECDFVFHDCIFTTFLHLANSPWPVQLFIEVQRNVILFFMIVYLLRFFILPDTWRDNSATFTLARKSKETLRYSVHGMAEGR